MCACTLVRSIVSVVCSSLHICAPANDKNQLSDNGHDGTNTSYPYTSYTSSLPRRERVTQRRDNITTNIAIYTRRPISLLSDLTLPQYLLCASSLPCGPDKRSPSHQIHLIRFMIALVFFFFFFFSFMSLNHPY